MRASSKINNILEVQEILNKLPKDCHLKLLIDKSTVKCEFNLIESYLNAPEFPLVPLGNKRKVMKKIHALPNKSLYMGEIFETSANGLGFAYDTQGNYYEGYFLDNKYSGKGRMIRSTGEIISGDWVEGNIATGVINYGNNKVYEGEIQDLEPHGMGKESSDDYVYTGNFHRSKKHGQGRVVWPGERSYEGSFVMGRIEGVGKFTSPYSTYEGEWKANRMHGNGTQTWPDGSTYKGAMFAGLKNGYGIYTTPTKKFSGFWKNEKEDGKGTLYENGKVISGIWRNGKRANNKSLADLEFDQLSDPKTIISEQDLINPNIKHINFLSILIDPKIHEKCSDILKIRDAEGALRWEDYEELIITRDKWISVGKGIYYGETDPMGRPQGKGLWLKVSHIYEGYWSEGLRHGFGREINLRNEVYIGNWMKNTKFGFGTLKKKNAKYIGEWENNKFNGNGLLATENLIYEGEWVQGLQHGKGVMEYPDGKVYAGEFKNGAVSGIGKFLFANGHGYEAVWKNGERVKIINKIKPEKKNTEIEELENDDLTIESHKVIKAIMSNSVYSEFSY